MDVPLPLAVHPAGTGGVEVGKGAEGGCLAAIDQQTGQAVAIPMQPCLAAAVDTLGLRHAVGSVRFLQVHVGLSVCSPISFTAADLVQQAGSKASRLTS